MNRWMAGLMGAGLFAAAASMAQAPVDPQPLESRLEARKVARTADGSERYSAAEAARPGDVIEYVATYRNTGKQPIKSVEATLPIPPGTEFIPGSARPAPEKVSADGEKFSAPPLMRAFQRDGKEVTEQVLPSGYRFLRWSAGTLSGSETRTYSARVRVLP